MITIDSHSRDMVANIVEQGASDPECFAWQSQLRTYWDRRVSTRGHMHGAGRWREGLSEGSLQAVCREVQAGAQAWSHSSACSVALLLPLLHLQ